MAQENILNLSLREYRKQISELKEELFTLTKGSEEYEKKCKEIEQLQGKVNQTLRDAKNGGTALEGSYNQLAQTMSELKKQWRETNDEAKRNELGAQINSINNQLKDFDASVGVFNRNVGDYSNQFVDALSKMGISLGGADKAFKLASTAGVGFRNVLTIISKHPIIATMTLLFGIFTKLKDAIDKNEESSNKWKVAMSAFKPILNAITNAVDWLAGKLVDLVLYISTSLPKVLNWIGGFSKGFFNVIGNIVDAITYIPKTLSKVMQTVVDYTFKGINAIAGKVGELLSAVGLDDWAGKVVNASKSAGDALQGFYQGAEKMFAGAGDAVRKFGTTVDNAMKSAGKSVETYQEKARKGIQLEKDLREEQTKTAESERKQAELRDKIAKASGKEKIALEKELQKEIITTAKRQSDLAERQYKSALAQSKLTPNSKEDNERLAQLKANWITAENQAIQTTAKIEQKIKSQEDAMKKAMTASAKQAQAEAEKVQKAIEKASKDAVSAYNKQFQELSSIATTKVNEKKSEEEVFKSAGLLTTEMIRQYANERYTIQKELLDEEVKLTQNAINNEKILEEDKVALQTKLKNLIIQQIITDNQHQAELNKNWLEDRKKTYDEDVKNFESAYSKKTEKNAKEFSTDYVDVSDKYLEGKITYEQYQEQMAELQQQYENDEMQREIDHLQEMLDTRLKYLEDVKAKFGEKSEEYLTLKSQYDKEELALETKKTKQTTTLKKQEVEDDEKNKKKKKKIQDQQLSAYSSFSSGMQALLGENNKATKALAISDAIVSTWKGANEVIKEGPKPYGGGPWGTALMYANMAGIIASGLANVKNIMSESTNESGTSSSTAQPQLSSAVVSPLLNENMDVMSMYNINANQSNRVYVVESDIRDVQNKVEVVESNSSF